MLSFGIALAVSLLVSLVILRIAYFTQRFGMDADVHDRRRVHARPVPRDRPTPASGSTFTGTRSVETRCRHTSAGSSA